MSEWISSIIKRTGVKELTILTFTLLFLLLLLKMNERICVICVSHILQLAIARIILILFPSKIWKLFYRIYWMFIVIQKLEELEDPTINHIKKLFLDCTIWMDSLVFVCSATCFCLKKWLLIFSTLSTFHCKIEQIKFSYHKKYSSVVTIILKIISVRSLSQTVWQWSSDVQVIDINDFR